MLSSFVIILFLILIYVKYIHMLNQYGMSMETDPSKVVAPVGLLAIADGLKWLYSLWSLQYTKKYYLPN